MNIPDLTYTNLPLKEINPCKYSHFRVQESYLFCFHNIHAIFAGQSGAIRTRVPIFIVEDMSMIETCNRPITIGGEWLDTEPLTPKLESALLNSGMSPSEVADLKAQGSTYCRHGEFFIPPLADFTSACGTTCQCRHGNKAAITCNKCQACSAWVYLRGFISAVQLNDKGTYKAIQFYQDTA
jgi:hypothetical protein